MAIWIIVFVATLWFAIPEVIVKESDRRRKLRRGVGDETGPESPNPQKN